MRKALYVLGELGDRDLQWILDAGCARQVESGGAIISEDVPTDEVFIIVDGEFEVTMGASVVAQLGAGELVGDMSLVESLPPSATVTATQQSTVFALGVELIRSRLEHDSDFAARFYRSLCLVLSSRLRRTDNDLHGRQEDSEAAYEISPAALEGAALAGARFDWFQQRVRGLVGAR
jgi:CRP/FNR family cyclic AMP-dependent transcriptional regulator